MLLPQLSKRRKLIFTLIALCLGLCTAVVVTEVIFRVLESVERSKYNISSTTSTGLSYLLVDSRWGWKLRRGTFRHRRPEYDVTGHVNELFMNDEPYNPTADASQTRVLVLGDSHTMALGVSMKQAWVKVLQRRLNTIHYPHQFRLYNAAVTSYNLHQSLLRLIDQGPVVKPHYVIVGLSYATDLFDLLPPKYRRWANKEKLACDYFDFDKSGQLIEYHWPPQQQVHSQGRHPADSLRVFLRNFAIF